MKTYASRYPVDSTQHVILVENKLKLKNADPKALADIIERKLTSGTARAKALFGLKPNPPAIVKALADLHLEAHYSHKGKPITPCKPRDGWEAAKAYVLLKNLEVDPKAPAPIKSRSNSTASSSTVQSSQSGKSAKTVRWADLAENEK